MENNLINVEGTSIQRQYGQYPVTIKFASQDNCETENHIIALLMEAYAERVQKV